jgi:Na+-translocating ferredoxin:NAD+ oxidoreductase RnfD subunit
MGRGRAVWFHVRAVSQDTSSLQSLAPGGLASAPPLAWLKARWLALDPRKTIAVILFTYMVLGFTVLGFNRAPAQAALTTASACALEVLLCRVLKGQWIWPLSAMITSFSLTLLLNYSHDYFVLFVPVYFAIGSKYLFTFRGRHVLNPALAGLAFSLLFASSLLTAAPAYQWNGIESMSLFMGMLGVFFLVPKVKRGALVVSWLVSFTLLTALRAWIMRWHLPFETLFLGTLSSPAFFLFTFFMITDPATSPPDRKTQIWTGALLAVVDLAFHLKQSYFTFFYAALSLALGKLAFWHLKAWWQAPARGRYLVDTVFRSGYYRSPLVLGGLAVAGWSLYGFAIAPQLSINSLDWKLAPIRATTTGIHPKLGNMLERVDPRIHHVAKWLFSVGDAVAVGDYDADGRPDLFFTFTLAEDGDRNALYRNLGDLRFERVPLPAMEDRTLHPETQGISSSGLFADYDSDGDLDLLVTHACGTPVLLQNQLRESGAATFVDVTAAAGLAVYTNSMGANFLDANRDGRLDLIIGNVLPTELLGYAEPTRLNLFKLPEPEYEGDERMFAFMHKSWHMADNGGKNLLFLQGADGRFVQQDSDAWGLSATMWTLVTGAADLNQDGWTDLYVANDFGPDDLYFNEGGQRFVSIKGEMFGAIGKDTYKGMNASLVDVDNNGWLDVYVSNVHHALQAEGSLLWMFGPGGAAGPAIEDRATALGALNEQRFGWGASLNDFDNDGWVDIAQANGMVDDTPDKRFETCKDYWYVNEKVARAPPSIHVMANMWGDIRGFCIYGNELDRLYLNRGPGRGHRFVDVAEQVGLTDRANSRGVAAVDLDGDGDRDLVITHQFRPPSLYENVQSGARAWIGFDLEADGARCNRGAVGSRVSLRGAAGTQVREHQVATGFSAQDEPRVHFGLGAHLDPVTVEVTWCGQLRERFGPLAPGRYHRLQMGAGAPVD